MRAYTISGQNMTVANAAVTLAFFNPLAGTINTVLRAECSQHANATSAQQPIRRILQASAYPTLVSATPAKTNTGDPASGITGGTAGAAGTCGINASAQGGGTQTILWQSAFNVLNGWLFVPTPQEWEYIRAAESLGYGLQFPSAPGTLTGWNIDLTFTE